VAGQPHPDAEQLAEYADRKLAASSRASIEAHLAECADCRAVLSGAMDLLTEEARIGHPDQARVLPFRRRRALLGAAAVLAAAAAVVIAIRTPQSDPSGLGDLVAAVAMETVRPLEGRLVGFPYAPAPVATRAGDRPDVSPAIRIAAAAMEREAQRQDTPVTDGRLGVAYAVVGELENAVTRLERAATGMNAASALSDLSAVYLRRGRVTNRSDDYEKARVAAERAVAADPSLREACFNHALALEYLGRPSQAHTAWQRCLTMESDPVWASEIRDHLARSSAPAGP